MRNVMSESSPTFVSDIPRPRRAWTLRFSLLSLCILVAIACVAAAWYGMRTRERAAIEKAAKLEATVKSQQAEIRRLRAELGYLTIADRTKVHAVQLKCSEDYHWKWRVYLPPGKPWKLCYVQGQIPGQGFENVPASSSTIEGGEFTVEALIRHDEEGQRRFVIVGPGSRVSQSLDEQKFERLKTAGFSATGIGFTQTEVLDPAGPIELIRLRQHREIPGPPGSHSFAGSDDPEFGFLIWVE